MEKQLEDEKLLLTEARDWEKAERYLDYWQTKSPKRNSIKPLQIKACRTGEIFILKLNSMGDLSYIEGVNCKLFPREIRTNFILTPESQEILDDFQNQSHHEAPKEEVVTSTTPQLYQPVRNLFSIMAAAVEAELPIPPKSFDFPHLRRLKIMSIDFNFVGRQTVSENAEDCYRKIMSYLSRQMPERQEYKNLGYSQVVLKLDAKFVIDFHEAMQRYLSALQKDRDDFFFKTKIIENEKKLIILAWCNLYPQMVDSELYLSEDGNDVLNISQIK